ncbi:MAG: hypothetical protein IPL61_20165 [Myxococcales bacterium]|nr:hypothetical protein [Myxococcales bacterium]
MRLATLTLALAVTSASAHADVAKLGAAELKEIASSSCPYWSPTGPSVICLEASETVPGVVVTAVVAKARARRAIS